MTNKHEAYLLVNKKTGAGIIGAQGEYLIYFSFEDALFAQVKYQKIVKSGIEIEVKKTAILLPWEISKEKIEESENYQKSSSDQDGK